MAPEENENLCFFANTLFYRFIIMEIIMFSIIS